MYSFRTLLLVAVHLLSSLVLAGESGRPGINAEACIRKLRDLKVQLQFGSGGKLLDLGKREDIDPIRLVTMYDQPIEAVLQAHQHQFGPVEVDCQLGIQVIALLSHQRSRPLLAKGYYRAEDLSLFHHPADFRILSVTDPKGRLVLDTPQGQTLTNKNQWLVKGEDGNWVGFDGEIKSMTVDEWAKETKGKLIEEMLQSENPSLKRYAQSNYFDNWGLFGEPIDELESAIADLSLIARNDGLSSRSKNHYEGLDYSKPQPITLSSRKIPLASFQFGGRRFILEVDGESPGKVMEMGESGPVETGPAESAMFFTELEKAARKDPAIREWMRKLPSK